MLFSGEHVPKVVNEIHLRKNSSVWHYIKTIVVVNIIIMCLLNDLQYTFSL